MLFRIVCQCNRCHSPIFSIFSFRKSRHKRNHMTVFKWGCWTVTTRHHFFYIALAVRFSRFLIAVASFVLEHSRYSRGKTRQQEKWCWERQNGKCRFNAFHSVFFAIAIRRSEWIKSERHKCLCTQRTKKFQRNIPQGGKYLWNDSSSSLFSFLLCVVYMHSLHKCTQHCHLLIFCMKIFMERMFSHIVHLCLGFFFICDTMQIYFRPTSAQFLNCIQF